MYGILFFSLFEYVNHRFLLHFTDTGEVYHYVHGIHHLKPHGKSIHVPLYFISFFGGLFAYLAHMNFQPQEANNALIGFHLSYMLFEHIHMEIHHPYFITDRNHFIFSYHMYHHTKDKHMAYGFSMPFWDILCGTYPEEYSYSLLGVLPIPFLSFYGCYIKDELI